VHPLKDLQLHRLIPLATASAFSVLSCGGKASDGSSNGESNTSFQERSESVLQDYCERMFECDEDYGYYESNYATVDECVDELQLAASLYYNLDSRRCRRLFLDTLECLAELSCESSYQGCERGLRDLYEECAYYDYYDYDYDYDDLPGLPDQPAPPPGGE
jgi:hypothetical protein